MPSTPYFLCFHYFEPAAAHSHFSTSYTNHGLLFLSFRAPLSPFTSSRSICLSHGHVIHYSHHLGLMGSLLNLLTLFFPYCWASSCYWAPLPKWASTLSLFKGIVNDDDVCILLFFIIPLLVSWFTSWKFLVILDFYNGTHFFMSAAICILISSRFCNSTYSFLHFWGTNTHFFCFRGICRHFILQHMHLFLRVNATLTLLLLEQHLYCRK